MGLNKSVSIPESVIESITQRWPDLAGYVALLKNDALDYREIQHAECNIAISVRDRLIHSGESIPAAWASMYLYLMSCIAGEPYGAHAVWMDANDVAEIRDRSVPHIRRLMQRDDMFLIIERVSAQRTGVKRWIHVDTADAPV